MTSRILVVDDEPDIRFLLKDILEDEGYLVDIAEHARAANEIRQSSQPDLVLLDIWMPEIDGVTLLKEWKSNADDDCPVVMMSGHGTVETAVEATRYGAFDFVEKPLSMAKLLSTVKAALGSSGSDSSAPTQRIEEPVGNSKIVQDLREQMQLLRDSNTPVFLSGANGSGRQIWGNYLSQLSDDARPMRFLELSEDLTQCFPLTANLYIGEISALSEHQQMLLYQNIKSSPGSNSYRLIASSQYRYEQLAGQKTILPEIVELWRYAINIPTLEEHIEDIPELLKYYVDWYSEVEQLPYRHFGVASQNLLRNHPWRGGLTQLKQFIKRALVNSDEKTIEPDEVRQLLQLGHNQASPGEANILQVSIDLDMDLREAREVFEREYLSRHLLLSGNNITELARRVGQERTHLYRKLKSLGLYNKKHA